jgi:uncharacterized membrane protein
MRKLSSLFIAGLATLLPICFSVWIIWWLFITVDNILKPILLYLPGYYFPGIGFIITILLVLLVGAMATNIFGKKIIALSEKLVLRTPVLNKIYSTIKRIIGSLISPTSKNSFKKVVLVEFPRQGLYALGFITNENFALLEEENYCIFIPTTPNPTSGFFVISPKSTVTILNISIEKAMEMIISAGLINSEVKKMENLMNGEE